MIVILINLIKIKKKAYSLRDMRLSPPEASCKLKLEIFLCALAAALALLEEMEEDEEEGEEESLVV